MLWSKSRYEDYEFRPLRTTTTIRLIKVCRRKVYGKIACKIYHFDEEQLGSVKYHALSYVWGDARPTRKVYLRDQGTDWHQFPLHENLWQFLDYAWRHKQFGQLFWTDRLCLDQDSHEEISRQVPRMRAIYRSAELTVVWLKLKEEEQQDLRRFVRWRRGLELMPEAWRRVMRKRLSLSADEIWAQVLGNPWSRGLNHMPESWQKLMQKRLSLSADDVWAQVLNNPYWQRIWIVQEVVVAKKVCVTFEDVSIDLDELPDFFGSFETGRTYVSMREPAFWALFNMRAEGGKLPLWRILTDFSEYDSSRPSDRVYGLLGLVAHHDDGSSPVENIQVDYDKPTSHVILDAVFESSPPFKWYSNARHTLGLSKTGRISSLLAAYIRSSKTTQRHRDLAKLTLQTLDAFELIVSVLSWLIMHMYPRIRIDDLFFSAANTKWKPTIAQHAALVGVRIATGMPARLAAVKAQRRRMGMGPSPWRCTAHRYQDGSHKSLMSSEVVAGTTRINCNPKVVVQVCAERSKSCDGSTMTFEIPQVGLRLLVDTTGPDMTAYLSLYLFKVES